VFTLAVPWWEIVLRATIVYAVVWGGLRLTGKRELGQMTVIDLVVILLIANAVQNAMVGADMSVTGGMLAAGSLLALNRILAAVRRRSGAVSRVVEGVPTVLVQHGVYIDESLRREGVERSEVEMAMREHGIESVDAVKLAVLEVDGTISIVPATATVLGSRRRLRQFRKH
jgi:uncharacterized membrane protein YcaP (DUF421 family)